MNGQQRLESFGTKARFAFWFRAKNLFSSVDFAVSWDIYFPIYQYYVYFMEEVFRYSNASSNLCHNLRRLLMQYSSSRMSEPA